MFQEKIFIHKPDLNSELLAIDHQNQIGIFFQKNETDLYFGFIESTSDENLKSLIVQIEKFAKKNNFKKVIGPIDGATWNNYRFQFKIAVPNAYYGQPTYSKKICDVFLQSGFVVSEMYETIEIKNLGFIKTQLATFSSIPLAAIKFLQPTVQMLIECQSQFHTILNGIFKENLAYTEISSNESRIIFTTIQNTINYDLSLIAFNSENKIVGFMFNYLKGSTLYIKTIGFVTEYRNQGLSVFKMLNYFFMSLDHTHSFDTVVLCLMKKNNFPSLVASGINQHSNEYVLLEKIII